MDEYWQELVESWAYNKLKVALTIQPRALSITQGRVVGIIHYLIAIIRAKKNDQVVTIPPIT